MYETSMKHILLLLLLSVYPARQDSSAWRGFFDAIMWLKTGCFSGHDPKHAWVGSSFGWICIIKLKYHSLAGERLSAL